MRSGLEGLVEMVPGEGESRNLRWFKAGSGDGVEGNADGWNSCLVRRPVERLHRSYRGNCKSLVVKIVSSIGLG